MKLLDLNKFWEDAVEITRKQWPWPLYKTPFPPMCERCTDAMEAGRSFLCTCVRRHLTNNGGTDGKDT